MFVYPDQTLSIVFDVVYPKHLQKNIVIWLACIAAVSFPFPGGDRTSKRKSGRAEEHACSEQKIGEKLGGGEREGGGGGEKRNHLRSIPNILPNSVRPRTGRNSVI